MDLLKELEEKHKKLFSIMEETRRLKKEMVGLCKEAERLKREMSYLCEDVSDIYHDYLDLMNKQKKGSEAS